MKSKFAIILLATVVSCKESAKKEEKVELTAPKGTSFFLGTYTDTDSKGIYRYTLNEDGSFINNGLVAKSNNPSFLTYSSDRKHLLAVNEISDENKMGTVESFAVKGDSLQFINRSSSGGAHPCFITINENGNVLAANYTGGNIGLLQLSKDGTLSELQNVQQYSGKSITDRQDAPHAHSTWFDPNGNKIIAVDLGTDSLWFSRIDDESNILVAENPEKLVVTAGSGPRHLSFHPSKPWFYVINELNNSVSLFKSNGSGSYNKATTISTLPPGFEEDSFCADIHISSDGKFLYASNRGHNSLAIFKVDPESGNLTAIGHESVKGDWPRNFSLSPGEEFVVVANQKSQNLVSFKRDKNTGLLTYASEIKAPSPVCVLF